MSADLLREAAERMRSRALWCNAGGDVPEWYSPTEISAILRRSEMEHSRIDHDAEHIAAWTPDVALAIADLLDDFAAYATDTGATDKQANAVAHAYLGRPS